MEEMKSRNRSGPGELAVGPSSPIMQCSKLLQGFFKSQPSPDLMDARASNGGLLVGNHLLSLMRACGRLNGDGQHSVAIALLRSMEDALDVFAAITCVHGAADAWLRRELRPSDAAKAWVKVFPSEGSDDKQQLSEYRKSLRGNFAKYSHCSFDLCSWDLFHRVTHVDSISGVESGPIEVNIDSQVINMNAHAIDAHLTAHLLEFVEILKHSYSRALEASAQNMSKLLVLETEVRKIMSKHAEHRCQDVQSPPEFRRVSGQKMEET